MKASVRRDFLSVVTHIGFEMRTFFAERHTDSRRVVFPRHDRVARFWIMTSPAWVALGKLE
jgi:hypothetical protein